MSEDRPHFRRPWEEPLDEPEDQPSEAPQETEPPPDEPVPSPKEPDPEPEASDVDLTDWEAMASGPSSLDDMSRHSFANATTEEYRGLAEEINRLRDSEFERQAVVATMPGVDTGLVGFEDVTGRRGVTEEDVEAMEQARASDLTLRVASALGLVALLVGSLYLGGWWFTSFLTLVMLISLGEFYSTVRKVGYAPLALVGLLGVVAMPILTHSGSIYAAAGVAVAATVIVVLAFSLANRRYPLENASMTVFGMAWVGLLTFVVPFGASPHPVAYVLMVGLITAMVDIGSYFVGRGFGSRALAPSLSPNKTVEGFIGGLVAGVLTAAVLSTLPPYEDLGFEGSLILGLVIALIGPVGDLAESMVKRSLGVKDMGSVLPGHGGMLDRIDSFLFAVPAAFLFLFLRDLL
ncbi:MAG TPA: phosphatidate cytidylyltransferase [Acidimicrobiia bacterium]|nr:phosphatidate cytidylyltransferase [Acidimicrobiia bacterium]